METRNRKQTNNIDALISIGGIRGMTHDQALGFLAQKRTFIEGRGIAAEYTSLAFEYAEIGEEGTAQELRRKAQELRNEL